MKRQPLLILAISGLLALEPAFGAHSGGGGHSASHAVRPNERRLDMHRERERRDHLRGINAAVIYPWWLYGNDYSNPYNSNYNNAAPYASSPGASDNGSFGDTTPSAPDYNAARLTMAAIQSRQAAALQASPQWAQVSDDLQKAEAQLKALTEQMQSGLLARADYRAAVAEKQTAQERAALLHQQSNGDDAAIFAAAQDDLNASAAIAKIEREATANDPALTEAREHLQAAAAARQAQWEGLKSQVMNDPDWQAAKGQLTEAK